MTRASREFQVFAKPLDELLDSPAQRAFGKAKLETLPEYCRACDVRTMCNGECPKNRFIRTPDGEAGLNYLCAGYKRFFTHCQPFVSQVAAQWRRQTLEQQHLFVDYPLTASCFLMKSASISTPDPGPVGTLIFPSTTDRGDVLHSNCTSVSNPLNS